MSMKTLGSIGCTAALTLLLGAGTAVSAYAQDADRDQTSRAAEQDKADKADNTVADAWILTKVKAKFIGEDALKDSDIDVDVVDGIVVLKGTVASEAGRARAVAIAKETDGVARVDDRLAIGMARHDDDDDEAVGTAGHRDASKDAEAAARDTKNAAKDAAHDAKHAGKDAAHDAKQSTKDAAKDAKRESKDAVGTAGEAVTDGWITTKVKASFVGVDALEGSDIDVDTNDHVVTLSGTVPSAVARAEAVRLAKAIKGVTKVNDELTIGDDK